LFTFTSQLNQEKQLDISRKEKLKNLQYHHEKLEKEIDALNKKINTKLPHQQS
jgi:hypothetical protein